MVLMPKKKPRGAVKMTVYGCGIKKNDKNKEIKVIRKIKPEIIFDSEKKDNLITVEYNNLSNFDGLNSLFSIETSI